MSYEQKYLKYKQKYLELKQMIDELENNNTAENTVENTVENTENFVLSDTPANEQSGGYAVSNGAPVGNVSGVPNAANCAGSVNPQPKVSTPVVPQNPTAVVPPATAPISNSSPVTPPPATNSKNLTNSQSEDATTTDLKSDVEQVFNQLGGHEHYDPFDDDIEDASSSDLVDDSDVSASPSDYDAVYSPIASATLPPGKGMWPGTAAGPGGIPPAVGPQSRPTGLGSGDAPPFQ